MASGWGTVQAVGVQQDPTANGNLDSSLREHQSKSELDDNFGV